MKVVVEREKIYDGKTEVLYRLKQSFTHTRARAVVFSKLRRLLFTILRIAVPAVFFRVIFFL